MEFSSFQTLFELGVVFGFAFTIKSFQDQVIGVFGRRDYITKPLSKLDGTFGHYKTHFNNTSPIEYDTDEGQFSTRPLINEAKEKLEDIINERDTIFEEYIVWAEKKAYTFNFKTISLLSAVMCFTMLVVSGVFGKGFQDHIPQVLDGVFYLEICLLGYIIFFFLQDVLPKLRSIIIGRRYVFFGYLILLVTIIAIQHWTQLSWTKSWFVVVLSVVIPFLHYILYFFRSIYYSPAMDRSFARRFEGLAEKASTLKEDINIINKAESTFTVSKKDITIGEAKCPGCNTVKKVRIESERGHIEIRCKNCDDTFHYKWPKEAKEGNPQ